MLRAAIVLAFISTAVVVAAPAPPPSEKEQIAKLWGKTEGPGEFSLTGKQLTLRTIGQPVRGLIKSAGDTVPRVTRTVSGDFQMTVKVLNSSAPSKDVKHEEGWACTRAGLFVSGDGFAVEIHAFQYFSAVNGVLPENPNRTVWVDTWYPRGGSGSGLKATEAGKSIYLRLIRKDNVVSALYSFDGKEWSRPFTPRQKLDFPDGVTVGVFLTHSTHQVVDATFDGFSVEKLKPKPKAKK